MWWDRIRSIEHDADTLMPNVTSASAMNFSWCTFRYVVAVGGNAANYEKDLPRTEESAVYDAHNIQRSPWGKTKRHCENQYIPRIRLLFGRTKSAVSSAQMFLVSRTLFHNRRNIG